MSVCVIYHNPFRKCTYMYLDICGQTTFGIFIANHFIYNTVLHQPDSHKKPYIAYFKQTQPILKTNDCTTVLQCNNVRLVCEGSCLIIKYGLTGL